MVYNALAALTAAEAYGMPISEAIERVSMLKGMPGRYESIQEGQAFSVIVDYAYEPAALERLFAFAQTLKQDHRIIHITGSAGGGRDVARRAVIGELSAHQADITIVTNEDPYDEDPMAIITQVADAAVKAGKADGATLFRILDRGEAIQKAISLARPGDVVLITGKGSEPVMAVAGGKKIPWDDREEARKALRKASRL
jgi:UDP-N-acetylmuramyl tripeptide synthase